MVEVWKMEAGLTYCSGNWRMQSHERIIPRKRKVGGKKSAMLSVTCYCDELFFRNSRNSIWPSLYKKLGIACTLLYVGSLLGFDLEYGSTCSSETSVDFQRTTRRCIPEGRTLHSHRCEMLLSLGGLTPYSRLNSFLAGIMDSNFTYHKTICAFRCTADIILNAYSKLLSVNYS
jgi:hypothetical protein